MVRGLLYNNCVGPAFLIERRFYRESALQKRDVYEHGG